MEADFSGYATKAGLKCSDGRTISPEAFRHQDKMKVPLVVRLEGNKSAEGKEILRKSKLPLQAATTIDEAARLIVDAVRKAK